MNVRIYKYVTRPIVLCVECSPMVVETMFQSQVNSYQRLKKIILDSTLLRTQHNKVRIKSKVE